MILNKDTKQESMRISPSNEVIVGFRGPIISLRIGIILNTSQNNKKQILLDGNLKNIQYVITKINIGISKIYELVQLKNPMAISLTIRARILARIVYTLLDESFYLQKAKKH